MTVEYSKQTISSPNPIARFAHRTRYQLSLQLALEHIGLEPSALLDYGCGQGDFLKLAHQNNPHVRLVGYDPESTYKADTFQSVSSVDELADESIDVLTSFEVLEHLYDEERLLFYASATRLLKPDGVLLVSVPIIGGPTLLLKELNRMMLFRRQSDYSLNEIIASSFFGKPARRADNPRVSHKGFDFSSVEAEISSRFELERLVFSPFKKLPWYFNSQVFYLARRK